MVALAPGAEIVPTTFHPKLGNGISSFDNGMPNEKVGIETVEVKPGYDSVDPANTPNGNGIKKQNGLNGSLAPESSHTLSEHELKTMEVLRSSKVTVLTMRRRVFPGRASSLLFQLSWSKSSDKSQSG